MLLPVPSMNFAFACIYSYKPTSNFPLHLLVLLVQVSDVQYFYIYHCYTKKHDLDLDFYVETPLKKTIDLKTGQV